MGFWDGIGEDFVSGEYRLSISDLLAIGENIRVRNLQQRLFSLPPLDFVLAVFHLSKEQWLETERAWLETARKEVGVEPGLPGKDKAEFLASPAIVFRIISAARVVALIEDDDSLSEDDKLMLREVVLSQLNAFLRLTINSGLYRKKRLGGATNRSVYSDLKSMGFDLDVPGVRYLANPEQSFALLLTLLAPVKIREEAYL